MGRGREGSSPPFQVHDDRERGLEGDLGTKHLHLTEPFTTWKGFVVMEIITNSVLLLKMTGCLWIAT